MTENLNNAQFTAAAGGGDPFGDLLKQVREAAGDVYKIEGEIGRSKSGSIIYLAREMETGHLVALKLQRNQDATDGEDYTLSVVRTLDATLPGLESKCPECKSILPDWDRFCFRCGADLSSASFNPGVKEAAELLEAVKEATAGEYVILGQMDRADGTGAVYFAREVRRDKLVALRLKKESDGDPNQAAYSIGETQVFRPLAAELGATQITRMPPPQLPKQEGAPYIPLDTTGRTDGSAGVSEPPEKREPPKKSVGPKPFPVKPVLGLGAGAILLGIAYLVFRDPKPTPVPPPAPAVVPTQPPAVISDTHSVRADSGNHSAAPEVRPPDSGTVRLSFRLPDQAEVDVDGHKVRGNSIRVSAGTHDLALSAPGVEAVSERISVRAGQIFRWLPTVKQRAELATNHPSPPPAPGNPPATTPTCARAFGKQDWGVATTLCAKEAATGDAKAQRMYAELYDAGHGVPADRSQAASWYRKSADAGDHEAQVRLGYMARKGDGMKKDEDLSATMFRRAAEAGDPTASLEYGVALENGDGVDRNEAEAANWYRKSGDAGNTTAMRRLGRLLERGKGVPKSEMDAAAMYKRACDGNDADSCYMLGKFYKDGKGVPKSSAQALDLFKKAASLGNKQAADEVKDLEKKG